MPKNKLIFAFATFSCVMLILLSGLFDTKSPYRFNLKGKSIALEELEDLSGNAISLDKNSLIYIHSKTCINCKSDMSLFKQMDLKSYGNVLGLSIAGDIYYNDTGGMFSNVLRAKTSGFFVELGISFVPVTLVVGRTGEIIYSHIGKLNTKTIKDEIIPIISSE